MISCRAGAGRRLVPYAQATLHTRCAGVRQQTGGTLTSFARRRTNMQPFVTKRHTHPVFAGRRGGAAGPGYAERGGLGQARVRVVWKPVRRRVCGGTPRLRFCIVPTDDRGLYPATPLRLIRGTKAPGQLQDPDVRFTNIAAGCGTVTDEVCS
jgi:hypothetical protein